jgi:4-amino-4-deoxy-L-arabinose transferase-like glycosyltransferase
VRQNSRSPISDSGYFLRLLVWLGVILLLRLIAVYVAQIDLVMDEAQYWTWSRDLAFGYFSKPPLIAWLIRGTTEICGQSQVCIRSASPILYTLTSLVAFATARELFGARVGFWSAIVLITLPGVSYSSQLMTTDVPLLLMWTIVLYFWVMLVKRRSMRFAMFLGISLGIGLLTKQAMIYAVLCAACHAVVSRDARDALKGGRGLVAILIALALFSPNILWNAQNGFSTAKHTGANIGWRYPYVHPLHLLEYIGVQFGVFGPILFAVLLRAAWREIRDPTDQRKILLLAFSLPVLSLVLVQATLSHAHGNWSATAYPSATILVTAVMLELNRRILFRASLGLHLVVAAFLATAPAFAKQWPLFEELQFLRTTLRWQDVASAVRSQLAKAQYRSILVNTRTMAAEMLYYLRDVRLPLYVWTPGLSPTDHYQLTRPFTAKTPEPVLFVSLKPCPNNVLQSFADATHLGEKHVPLVKAKERVVYFCRLAGYEDAQAPSP